MIDAVKPRYSEAGTIVYLSICFVQVNFRGISSMQHTEFTELQNKFPDILHNWKF
jgi:glucose-6-phosphate isomerase